MARKLTYLLDRLWNRRALRRWGRAAEMADHMHLSKLRTLRGEARQLKREIDRVLHVAETRLSLPLIGAATLPLPLNADWAWRPALWTGSLTPPGYAAVESRTRLGGEATVYHDCRQSELTVRQIRNTSEADTAPFGLRLDVFQFDGSFLSLAVDLPGAAVEGLRQRHVIRADVAIEMEKPLEVFLRLNVKHGPNTEQIVRELPLHEADRMVEFDLAYTKMNEKRVERAWVDIIFEGPELNQIVLRDLTFSRRLRAEI